MGETEILASLSAELRLDLWWRDLIGQDAVIENFDFGKAAQSIPRTEMTTAQEIKRKFGSLLSYTEMRKRWYLWDERIHRPCDGDGIAIKVVKIYFKAVCDALEFVQKACYVEADRVAGSGITDADKKAKAVRDVYDKGEFSKHRAFRDKLSSDSTITAIMRMLRTECDVAGDYFDNDQQWFVTKNWVIDLNVLKETGEFSFLKHSPDRPVTKYFDADYNPNINLGHWDGFLTRSIPNVEMRNYLQKITGAAFMGVPKLRCIPNLYGPPGSGKSVFIGTIFKLGKEGAGYSVMPDSKAVVKVSGQNFEQDSMKGARFIGISEPSHTDKIDDDFLKKYTGDDWVETRTLNVKSSGWVPQGVIFIASNATLKINTREKAITNRVQIIEFPIEFESGPGIPEERRIVPKLEELLLEDRSRVLTWILIGMREFYRDGLKLHPPKDVLALRDGVVTDASTALRWVEEFVEEELLDIDYDVEPDLCISVHDAYTRYTMWAAWAGEKKPLTRRFFTQDIENKYGLSVKAGKTKVFPGLAVTIGYRRKFETGGISALDGRP
jgi:phage/plasmid-associated DNA primase